MRVAVSFDGAETLRHRLNSFNPVARGAVLRVVNKTAIDVQRDAKRNCPVKTGRLKSSIKLDFLQEGFAAEVSSNVEYAPHVEYGTSKWAGKPFLTPAWEAHRDTYLNELARALREL